MIEINICDDNCNKWRFKQLKRIIRQGIAVILTSKPWKMMLPFILKDDKCQYFQHWIHLDLQHKPPTLKNKMIEKIKANKFQKIFASILVVVFTTLFLYMIRNFITSILLAAIFAGLFYPFYQKVLRIVRQRRFLASGITVFLTFLLIVLPIIGLFNIVINEAIEISQHISPEMNQQFKDGTNPDASLPDWVPFVDVLEPIRDQLFSNLDETTGRIGNYLVSNLSSLGQVTISFIVNLFVLLYGMYFFFIRGDVTLEIARRYVPLSAPDFQTMLDKGMMVTMATLKGAVFIGILQGLLVGLAFWALGLSGPFFWGTISAVASVIPTFGCGLIWIPATIYLMLTGETTSAIALFVWGAGVVGVVDNLLRPYLVGKDAHMPDLLILISTLGGLGLFGATGFIIGPVLAAFLLTVWEIFQYTFEQELS